MSIHGKILFFPDHARSLSSCASVSSAVQGLVFPQCSFVSFVVKLLLFGFSISVHLRKSAASISWLNAGS
jgi:hypothetical protein